MKSKKILAGLLSLCLAGAVIPAGTLQAGAEIVLYGDIDSDGRVIVSDLAYLQNYLKTGSGLTDSQLQVADMNQDGIVDEDDYAAIYRYIISEATATEISSSHMYNLTNFTKAPSLYGDVNLDDTVDINDYFRLIDILSDSTLNVTNLSVANANVNADNILEEGDARILLKYINGKISSLPLTNPSPMIYGDINFDGTVSSADSECLVGFLAGSWQLTDQQKKTADVNQDGSVDEYDFAEIYRIIAKLGTQKRSYDISNVTNKVTLYGDIDLNGTVDYLDYYLLINTLHGVGDESNQVLKNADVNTDNVVDEKDTQILLKYLYGGIASLPDSTGQTNPPETTTTTKATTATTKATTTTTKATTTTTKATTTTTKATTTTTKATTTTTKATTTTPKATTTTTKATTTTTKATTTTTKATTTTTKATTTTTKATTTTTKATTTTTKATTTTATSATATTDSSNAKFTWGKDNWDFNNTSRFFTKLSNGSEFKDYHVNEDIMYQLKDDFHITNTQFENIRREIEKINENPEKFGGSCFGMTVSQILVKQGSLDLTHYGGSNVIHDNTNTEEILSVINFIQNLQSNSELAQAIRQRAVIGGNYHYTQAEILERIANAAENGDFLMKLGIRIDDANGESGGHAVLVYGVEDCDYYSVYTYKKYDKRLLIADPNYLKQNKVTDNACMYYNSSDYSWIIPIYTSGNQSCYWNASSGEKTPNGAINNIMRYDSLTASKDLMITTEMKDYVAGLEVDTSDLENTPKFSRVANTGNPNMEYASANSSGVFEYNLEWANAQSNNTKVYAAPDNTASYELTYNNPTDFSLMMDYEQISYFADVENSSYALFKPSGQFMLRGSNASYDVAIVTNDNKCVTDWYSVGVSGARTDNLTYTLTKAGYELTSDNLKNITVSAHNDKVSPSLTFSTDYTSVLIYEIDENTIGIKADTDNDGSYDTVIAQSENASYGDVTGDEEIDIRDVIMINKAIFGKITLTDEQNKAADINKDGMPDASDSLTIMKYIVKLIDTLD